MQAAIKKIMRKLSPDKTDVIGFSLTFGLIYTVIHLVGMLLR